MQRFTISIEDDLAEAFSAWIAEHRYSNRSEAIRDLLRERFSVERQEEQAAAHCAASVSYVYNHHERELSRRLNAQQHAHHELAISTLHVHLDHDQCLEVSVLRGPLAEVRAEALALIAQRGVRHGKVHLVPLDDQGSSVGWHRH